jgi:hypothetical protein
MSEHRSEHRIKLEGVESVQIFNPVGRIVITGWGEPDLFLDYTVTLPGDPASSETLAPHIDISGAIMSIQPPKQLMEEKHRDDINISFKQEFDDEMEDFGAGFSDFVGKIVTFAQRSGKKVMSGVKISMDIRLPRGMAVTVKNLNGVIAVSNMEASVRAKGLNGPISLSAIKGPVIAQAVNGPVTIEKSACPELLLKSVNGPVKCYLDALPGPVTLKTVNGPVRLMLPQNAEADLSVKTFHGAIKIGSDFTTQNRTSRVVRATLNAARFPVSIKSTTGSVTVGTSDDAGDGCPGKTPVRKKVEIYRATQTRDSRPDEPVIQEKPVEKNLAPGTGKQPDPLEAQIDRMLLNGTITADEAERLRRAI